MRINGTQQQRFLIGLGLGALAFGIMKRLRTRPGHPDDRPGTAAITGASSGIGAEFARQLAARGCNLFLVARRADRLATLAAELEQRYGIATEILVADLANPPEVQWVEKRLAEMENLTFLVNNAGFGTGGKRFAFANLDKQLEMVQVHDLATVRLTRAVLPGMLARRRGAVINVSSFAALIPVGGNAIYAASKAFLNAFSQALSIDLRATGVRIQALCPGFTRTEFHDTPQYQDRHAKERIPGPFWLSASKVVATSLAALERDQVVVVPGWHFRLAEIVARSGLVVPIVGMFAKRMRGLPPEPTPPPSS